MRTGRTDLGLPEVREADPQRGAPAADEKANILVVDDRKENLFALEAILKDLGHRIVQATSGRQALEFLLDHDAAVILLDVRMPVMDGFETAELIRRRRRSRHIPVIFLTAMDATPEGIARAYGTGAVDYIFKPFRPEVLRAKVAVFLDLYRKSDQLRRQAQALRASEARFRTLVQNIPGALYRLGPGRPPALRFLSPRIQEILGWTASDCLEGRCALADLVHPDDAARVADTVARAFAGSDPYMIEYRLRHRDGSWRWVVDRGQAVAGADGEVASVDGALFDVTHRREAEEQIRRRTAELEAVNRELEAFSYSVSHDLRAPLRAMHGFSEALLEDYGPRLDATGREYLQRIGEASRRMDALIQDLLLYSRLTRVDIELRPVGLEATLAEVLEAMKPELQERLARVEVEVPLPRVLAHDVTLRQVLTNLVSNAAKFVGPGVPPRIRIRAETSGGLARLWVEDNGIGIAPEHQGRLFRVFERLNTIESYPGTGIGLAIVRKAMERMGGKVGLESEVGRGSRFWIELPEAARQGTTQRAL